MATFYLDFEGGNDANNGTTFANRWKTLTSGATAARIAPGDEIRIMGSPAPTSLGQNGVWTSQALQATKTLTAATNATPIAITITGHGYSTGDTVVVTGVVGNTAANGTWEITVTDANTFTLDGSAGNGARTSGGTVRLRNNTRVMLTTAVTQNIASYGAIRTAWTAVAGGNVTTAIQPNSTKEGYASDSIAIGTNFTTGKAAYWTLPSTLDLSTYQQVSLWFRLDLGAAGLAGSVDIRLCSDTIGDTAVNTVSIPAYFIGRWMPVTVDLGTNLGNSIQSIAFYVNTDNGAQTFLLSNIIACKASSAADSLTLTSLIGKNTTGETFWGIQSINGRRVMLDADTNATPTSTSVRGYYGTSETVTTWKRETIKLGPAASSITALQTIQDSGTDGNPITFSGGWDRTNMSTQNLETWLDGVNGNGRLIDFSSRNWITLDGLAGVRATGAFHGSSSSESIFSVIAANNCSSSSNSGGFNHISGNNLALSIKHSVANGGSGVAVTGSRSTVILQHLIASNNNSGVYSSIWRDGKISASTAAATLVNNNSGVFFPVRGCAIEGLKFESNATGVTMAGSDTAILKDVLFNESTEVAGFLSGEASVAFSHNHNQAAGNHKIFMNGALISAATDQRKTASGISWKIQPTSANRSSAWPVPLSLAKVACAANSQVTIKTWMRRTNTGLTMRLVCKGGQIAGVTNDVTTSMAAAADTWEELTITFTPTEVGVVEIIAEAWGGTTYSGWVDDMTISQA